MEMRKRVFGGEHSDTPTRMNNLARSKVAFPTAFNEAETVQIKLAERRRIAEAALCDLSPFTDQKGFRRHISLSIDMIALCKRRERQRPRTNCSRERLSVKTEDDPII